jgi:hypothetical protein
MKWKMFLVARKQVNMRVDQQFTGSEPSEHECAAA